MHLFSPTVLSRWWVDDAVPNDTTCCIPMVLRRGIMRQAHRARYMVDQLKYVSLAATRRSSRIRVVGVGPVPAKFGELDDRTKYCGAELTDHYLRDV